MRFGTMEISPLNGDNIDIQSKPLDNIIEKATDVLGTNALKFAKLSNAQNVLETYAAQIDKQIADIQEFNNRIDTEYGHDFFGDLLINKFKKYYIDSVSQSKTSKSMTNNRFNNRIFEEKIKDVLGQHVLITIDEALEYLNIDITDLPKTYHQIQPLLDQFEQLGETNEPEYMELLFKAYGEMHQYLENEYQPLVASIDQLFETLKSQI